MPWTKALAQLPTPTIPTRTLPSSTRCPLAPAPSRRRAVSVLIASQSSSRRVAFLLPPLAPWLHPGEIQSLELAPHVPHALCHGERRQCSHSVDRRRQELNV